MDLSVDMSFGQDNPDFMQWRVNIVSKGRALLMLFLFSDVGEADAPTRIRVGSHAQIARQLLPHGPAGLSLAELAANGFNETSDCPEVLATGTAGTVYLCHPFLVHSAQPHRGKAPRFLAQPPLLPLGGATSSVAEYSRPNLDPNPTERRCAQCAIDDCHGPHHDGCVEKERAGMVSPASPHRTTST